MNFHELDAFQEEIELMEQFFTEFAAQEEEILAFGMPVISRWES
jgi:hypothetical protein